METITPASASPKPAHPKFVRWALMIGIIIALNLAFFAIRSLVFPAPQYENFCPQPQPVANDQASCTTLGGSWTASVPSDGSIDATGPKVPNGYCDFYAKCQKPFEDAQKQYQLEAFAIMVGFGVVALIIGVLPIGSSIVSTGLSYGGVVSLIIGAASYWNEAGNWIRLAIALIALVAFLYIGIKRFKD